MSDWQPIETAPKDWTVIVGRDATGAIGLIRYDRRFIDRFDVPRGAGWIDVGGSRVTVKLTHWVPLPAPLPVAKRTKLEGSGRKRKAAEGDAENAVD